MKNNKLTKMKEHGQQIATVSKQRFSLTLIFAIVVFVVLAAAIGLAALAIHILSMTGVTSGFDDEIQLSSLIGYMAAVSFVIGAAISLLLALFPLKPVNDLINHMNRLAAGDFKTRLKFRGIFAEHPAFLEISRSFDKLAVELESTELLRSDFINNFSHEFKTPIVSIAGLAKLVNRGDLPEGKRSEYLIAIEEESKRLASLATNALLLTKVEKQMILTDTAEFNLSEQIRSSVLLLENKWSAKRIEPVLDFDEYNVIANEELLREVWINLIDNAIKFSPSDSEIRINAERKNGFVYIDVINKGEISENDLEKVFNKFYQSDRAHTAEGNGIGLAIVKKILDLHDGEISVGCEGGEVKFTVTLACYGAGNA